MYFLCEVLSGTDTIYTYLTQAQELTSRIELLIL